MSKRIGILATVISLFCGAQGVFATKLVTNGGFETGNFKGWTLSGPVTTSEAASNFYSVDTQDKDAGTYGAYLGSEFSVLTLSQNLTVTDGQEYVVSFSLAQDSAILPGFTNSFLVTLGGQTVFSEMDAPVSAYTDYSFGVYVPAGADTSETLSFASENDLGYFSLDKVGVNPAPEPATLLLIAPAIGLLALLRRKLLN
jgi:hypothetical protein